MSMSLFFTYSPENVTDLLDISSFTYSPENVTDLLDDNSSSESLSIVMLDSRLNPRTIDGFALPVPGLSPSDADDTTKQNYHKFINVQRYN